LALLASGPVNGSTTPTLMGLRPNAAAGEVTAGAPEADAAAAAAGLAGALATGFEGAGAEALGAPPPQDARTNRPTSGPENHTDE